MRQFIVNQMSEHTPGALNVARQITRRARTWWRHQLTSTYLLSYPGCGRTWLTILIGKTFIDGMDIADIHPSQLTELARARREVPRVWVLHDDRPQLRRPEDVVRDKRRFASKSVVLLLRDPRDAIISYYFEASKRRGRFDGTPGEFIRNPIGGIDTLIAYYNVWANNRDVPRKLCVVHYEELRREPVVQLERVMQAIGYVPPRAVLEGAVEFGKFENLRKVETKGDLRPDLDRHKTGDAESFKVRKGRVGGYREYLSPEDIDWLDTRIAQRLSPFYREYLKPPKSS